MKEGVLSAKQCSQAIDRVQQEELDLRDIFKALWRGKWFVFVVVLLFAVGSIFYSLSLNNEYRSTAILAPASSDSNAMSKLAGQFGGLASIAGVSLASGEGVDKVTIALELVTSWGFLEEFIDSRGLSVELFAAKGWDQVTNELIIDSSLYDRTENRWLLDEKGESKEPSSWETYKSLSNKIVLSRDKKSGLISLSVDYISPDHAKQWVDEIVLAINSHMQEKDKAEALRNISYLKNQISKTDIAEMRTIFFELIEEQTKKLMLAEVSDEYVFKVVSMARAPAIKIRPGRASIVITYTVLGFFVSLVLLALFNIIRK